MEFQLRAEVESLFVVDEVIHEVASNDLEPTDPVNTTDRGNKLFCLLFFEILRAMLSIEGGWNTKIKR